MATNQNKSAPLSKRYYKISEVSQLLGINQSTLRNWESSHPKLRSIRRIKNQRYYTPLDIDYIRSIHDEKQNKSLPQRNVSTRQTNVSETNDDQAKTSSNEANKVAKLVSELRAIQTELKDLSSRLSDD